MFTLTLLATGQAQAQTVPLSVSVLDVDPGNTVLTGSGFRYRINYRCSSTTTACAGAVLTWSMPPELVFVSAQGTGDVASIADPGAGNNGPVVFTFNDPVPAGNTGDLDITVRFPNGSTADGTVTTGTTGNTTVTGTNFPPSTASSPVVTAVASAQVSLNKIVVGGQAFLDGFPTDTTYRLTVSASGSPGSLDLTGVVVVDTLPPGVTFISANNGGVNAAGTVTWDNGGSGFSIAAGGSLTLEVTVRFETPTFTDGQMVSNSFSATVDPLGEPPDLGVGPFVRDHTVDLFVPAPDVYLDKRLGGGYPSPAIGQTFIYDLLIRNNGNVDLDSIVVTDTVPSQLDIVSVNTGSYNSGYTGTVSVSYSTNLGGPFALGSSPGNTNATLTIPALGAGEYVTEVVWSLAGPIPEGMQESSSGNRARLTATLISPDNLGNPVSVGDTITNCADIDWTYGIDSGTETDCRSFTVSDPFSYSSPVKRELSSGPYLPGDTITFRLDLDNQSQASDPLPEPIVVDLLPEFVAYSAGTWSYDDRGTGVPAPTFEEIPNFAGTGRTLLRWTFPPASALAPGQEVRISFDTVLVTGAVAGTMSNSFSQTHNGPGVIVRCAGSSTADAYDMDGDASTTDTLCTDAESFTVASVAQLESEKLVRGQLDAVYHKFPNHGMTVRGGFLDYRFRVTNIGTVPVTDLVLVDILPFVGDTGVLDLTARETGWQPFLASPIQPPPGGAVYYSTSGNPCRAEVGGPTSGCDPAGWSTVPPDPITSVRSYKIEFGDLVVAPQDSGEFNLRMIAPADAPVTATPATPLPGEIAWNSFGFGADRVDGGFLNAEPLKVGIVVVAEQPAALGDLVWLDSDGNGVQDDGDTGVNDIPVSLWQPGPDGLPLSLDDVLVASTITADSLAGLPGWYRFSDLGAGDYFVCFEPPPGYEVTLQDQGDDALDSDPSSSTECTAVTTLGPGDEDLTLDLGLVQSTTAALGNYVWFDENDDGLQNEPVVRGINGTTVRLFLDDGDGVPEPGGDDGAPVAYTITADDDYGAPGYYLFEDLVPGVPYFVQFLRPTTATGFTARNAGADDAVDSDVEPNPGPQEGTSQVVTLAAGEYNSTIDAGLRPDIGPLALGNLVWGDSNDNGLYEPLVNGETGINDVRLNLYRDDNGNSLPDSNEYFGATYTHTAAGKPGTYLFDELPAGDYIVQVDLPNFTSGGALQGMVSSSLPAPPTDPDDDVDHDDEGEGVGVLVVSLPVTLTAGGEPVLEDGDADTNLTVDFGFLVGVVTPPEYDYGDNPDAGSGTGSDDYQTLALDLGAFHELGVASAPYLGACVDSDAGAAQGPGADMDDTLPAYGTDVGTVGTCAVAGDDEDGVVLPADPAEAGLTYELQVTASAGTNDCALDAWIDWNQSGLFGDGPDEAVSQTITSGTTATVTFNVPASAVPGTTYARLRCSTAGGLAPAGYAADGEVEDYRIRVLGFDFGDAGDSYSTLLLSGGPVHEVDPEAALFLGSCVDTEADGQPTAAADGDDTGLGSAVVGVCLDDEEGIGFDTPLVACQQAVITATVGAVGHSGDGLLSAWIDFNGNGVFDGSEQVASDQVVALGANVLFPPVTIPCDAVPGWTTARFRLSTDTGLGSDGPASDGEVEDHLVLLQGSDWGDAPDSYSTTMASAGAHHGVSPLTPLFLGSCVDTEIDGVPGIGADSDDLAVGAPVGTCAGNDDEDGVVFTSLVVACQLATLDVTANAAGVLDAWVDFNRNGNWTDPGEQVFSGQALAAGTTSFGIAVPCTAVPGATYARFRFSSAGVPSFDGPSLDGEVEDYLVNLLGADLGDAPDSYATLITSGGPSHGVDPASPLLLGTCVDTESNGQPTLPADGDDLGAGTVSVGSCTGGDDEDGVVFDTPLVACETAQITVTAVAAGFLDAWIDANANGSFGDAGEQLLTSTAVAPGATVLGLAIPCSAVPGNTYARFRLSAGGGLGYAGPSPTGEVEDYLVQLSGADFGDAPASYQTLLGDGGARHAVDPTTSSYLGTCVDTEADGQPGAGAGGDDAGPGIGVAGTCTGADDEDGVSFDTPLLACEQATVTVTSSLGWFLDAWIDFDGDGTFGGANDQIRSSQPLAAGANSLDFTVPCDAVPGTTYARFRLSSGGGLTATGAAADGEVEDHQVLVGGADFGDAPDSYGTSLASTGAHHGVTDGATLYLGACVDTEADGQAGVAADGDDSGAGIGALGTCAGNDDEDGVTFDDDLVACASAGITVDANDSGYLNAWIDFDQDGAFAASEQIAAAQAVNPGANALVVNVPCSAIPGDSYARFRVASTPDLEATGPASDGEVEDYLVTLVASDLGDAPDSYATLAASGGPYHRLGPLYLGSCVDSDQDGQPSVGADGDDLGAGTGNVGGPCTDDEDGVSFDTPLSACADAQLTVTASAAGLLDAWIDFDGDGAFTATEQAATGQALAAGANVLTVPIPCDAASGDTYARFRLSTTGGLSAGGGADDGEVEDYLVTVQGLDYGDAPDVAYQTLLASDGARHTVLASGNPVFGLVVDTEPDGQPGTGFTGDDLDDGNDDEDGISFPSVLVPGTDGTVEITTGATGGVVSGWVDFNGDGDWADAGEQVVTDLVLGAGVITEETFPVPVGATEGTTGARFRISSAGGLGWSGPAADGEVEDYPVAVGTEEPLVGVAGELVTLEALGGCSRLLATCRIPVQNFGNVPLSEVNVAVDLATVFAGANSFDVVSVTSDDFAVNPGFDGDLDTALLAAGNDLAVAESASIELVVEVSGHASFARYELSFLATASSPAGAAVSDESTDGGEPDGNDNGDPGDDDSPTLLVCQQAIPDLGTAGRVLLVLLLALAGVVLVRQRLL